MESRFRKVVNLSRKWDPAKHPRGPLGRFAMVGAPSGSREAARGRTTGARGRVMEALRASEDDPQAIGYAAIDPGAPAPDQTRWAEHVDSLVGDFEFDHGGARDEEDIADFWADEINHFFGGS